MSPAGIPGIDAATGMPSPFEASGPYGPATKEAKVFEAGQVYTCSNCGAEIQVTRSANMEQGGDESPVCCCGQAMQHAGASAQGAQPQRHAQGPTA